MVPSWKWILKNADLSKIEEIREPIITATILVPEEYVVWLSPVYGKARLYRKICNYMGRQVMLVYKMPLNEVVMDFW